MITPISLKHVNRLRMMTRSDDVIIEKPWKSKDQIRVSGFVTQILNIQPRRFLDIGDRTVGVMNIRLALNSRPTVLLSVLGSNHRLAFCSIYCPIDRPMRASFPGRWYGHDVVWPRRESNKRDNAHQFKLNHTLVQTSVILLFHNHAIMKGFPLYYVKEDLIVES